MNIHRLHLLLPCCCIFNISTSTPLSGLRRIAMTNSMGPPPPINPNLPDTAPSMPPPRDSTEPQPSPPPPPRDSLKPPSQGVAVPYKIPPWSASPCHQFYLEVLKDGSIIDKFDVCEKGAYMFGRLDLCDFVLEHPTISRFHAGMHTFVYFSLLNCVTLTISDPIRLIFFWLNEVSYCKVALLMINYVADVLCFCDSTHMTC